jgi:hypothetical protein
MTFHRPKMSAGAGASAVSSAGTPGHEPLAFRGALRVSGHHRLHLVGGRPAAILFAENFSLLQRRSGRVATNNATISMSARTTGSTKNVSTVASSSAGCQESIDAIVEPAYSAAEGLELTVFCSSAAH